MAQRILSAGLDGALAGRYWTPDGTGPRSLFVLRDRQGTTLGAYRADGTPDPLSWYQPLGAFGAPAGDGSTTSGGKGSATATGFTGAGAPSASGGYVYLRNRWYDPQTGRFLTQDPIGLAGGINLYAYAGNDPVNFSDPFGLWPCTVCRLLGSLTRAALHGVDWLSTHGFSAADWKAGWKMAPGIVLHSGIVGATGTVMMPHAASGTGTRYMGSEEASAVEQTETIPNTNKKTEPRVIHYTEDPPRSASAAQQRYNLDNTPTHSCQFPLCNVQDQAQVQGSVAPGPHQAATSRPITGVS